MNLTTVLLRTLITFLFLAISFSTNAADKLFRNEIKEKHPGGEDFIMSFEELRRDNRTSTARVKYISGAPVGSAMFIMHGFYEIAHARNMTYFVVIKKWQVSDKDSMYTVGFSRSKNINTQKYFGLNRPLPKSDEYKFVAVEDLDAIFKHN